MKREETKYMAIYDHQTNEVAGFSCLAPMTAKGWLESAVEWLDLDEVWENDKERKDFINTWLEKIEHGGREQLLINYIAENWDLDIVRASEPVLKMAREVIRKECGYEADF